MAYTLSNKCAKNLCSSSTYHQKQNVVTFFGTHFSYTPILSTINSIKTWPTRYYCCLGAVWWHNGRGLDWRQHRIELTSAV